MRRPVGRSHPAIAFDLPDGKEIEGGVGSNLPCCSTGDHVRVPYHPALPGRVPMVGFLESWLVAPILDGMGIVLTGAGLAVRKVVSRIAVGHSLFRWPDRSCSSVEADAIGSGPRERRKDSKSDSYFCH